MEETVIVDYEKNSVTNKISKLELENSVANPSSVKQLESFLEASKMFDEMLEKGLVKRRGYNLMTIDTEERTKVDVNSNMSSLLYSNKF